MPPDVDKDRWRSGQRVGARELCGRPTSGEPQEAEQVALVEELGTQVDWSAGRTWPGQDKRRRDKQQQQQQQKAGERTSTIATIAAKSNQTRLVVGLLRDGLKPELKIQEMRPGLFDPWFETMREAAATWDGSDPIRDARPSMRAAIAAHAG